jgi:outer membrane protein OmpA-like peptidoglycan-associated protein
MENSLKSSSMMRFSILVILNLFTLFLQAQQPFSGFRSGNYSGVNGVFYNPASIVDSRYRWDVNLVSTHVAVGNNFASFQLRKLPSLLRNDSLSIDSMFLKTKKATLAAMVNADITGPSVMFHVNARLSMALTTRFRSFVNISDVDKAFAQTISNQISNATYPYQAQSSYNQHLSANAWAEYGVSGAYILMNQEQHFLKGGVSLKYLAGYGNAYLSLNRIGGTVNENSSGDDYLTGTSGSISGGIGGVLVDQIDHTNAFRFRGKGAGLDFGFMYEYRPDHERLTEHYQNKYRFKVGIALLDVGSIRYKTDTTYSGGYQVNIPAEPQRLQINQYENKDFAEVKSMLQSNAYFSRLTAPASYRVNLPATLQLQVDWNIGHGFYLDLASQLSLHSKNRIKNPFYPNQVTLTPRFEWKSIGCYLPISYSGLTSFNAGFSFKAGPFFIGSGSILTAWLGQSRQADFHLGVRFGNLYKKPRLRIKDSKSESQEVLEPGNIKDAPLVVDTDQDGVIDEKDRCPSVPGSVKYEGCPIPDTDGDGLNDEQDQCPTIIGSIKYQGCPIPDTDGDGLDDEKDQCPNEKGIEKYNGCPAPDADKDGVDDDHDKCPELFGFSRYEGCPIPDRDRDGLNDEEDQCPELAGPVQLKGCPEINIQVQQKVKVAAKNIFFNTGSAELKKISFASLNEVVKILKETPSYILLIEGHTDSVGVAEHNLALSEDRALAVKTYIISQGIAEARILAKGYGQKQPIADNKTAAGRAKNRRVELKLTY